MHYEPSGGKIIIQRTINTPKSIAQDTHFEGIFENSGISSKDTCPFSQMGHSGGKIESTHPKYIAHFEGIFENIGIVSLILHIAKIPFRKTFPESLLLYDNTCQFSLT